MIQSHVPHLRPILQWHAAVHRATHSLRILLTCLIFPCIAIIATARKRQRKIKKQNGRTSIKTKYKTEIDYHWISWRYFIFYYLFILLLLLFFLHRSFILHWHCGYLFQSLSWTEKAFGETKTYETMLFQEGFLLMNCAILPVKEECKKFIRLVLCLLMLPCKMQRAHTQKKNNNSTTTLHFSNFKCATNVQTTKRKYVVKCPSPKRNEWANNKGWRKNYVNDHFNERRTTRENITP